MKKKIISTFIILSLLPIASFVMAEGCRLEYKLKPGQKWLCSYASKNESIFMGKKNVNQSKKVYEYVVSEGPKNGWVSLTARIQSDGSAGKGTMDLSKVVFTADIHSSGEVRNIKYTGSVSPDLGEGAAQLTPEMKKMLEQSYNMIPEAYKNSVFWFPEVPEEKLEIGDEFEVQRKIGMGGSQMGVHAEAISRQVFTLEDVSKGLAYFSVKERSVSKVDGLAGGRGDTKIAGKGDAIFDLEQGMWLELTEKSKANINLEGMAGVGDINQDMNIILKYEMEKQ